MRAALTRKTGREMARPLVCDCVAREGNSSRRPSSSCFEKALRGSVPVSVITGQGSGISAAMEPGRWQLCEWRGGTWRPLRSGSWRRTTAKPASCPSPPAEAGSRLFGDGERAQAGSATAN